QGYCVETAKDSEDGMEQLKAARPDLIILDVMMNSLREGFVLSRALKEDSKYKHIPILMVTAAKEKIGIDFKPAAGDEAWLPVEEFLEKPVEPELLLNKVKELLHES
ncbi:MAG: response regulator, partial [Planctomycetota bacterium]